MKLVVAFRADASSQMGTGHVMRCLTLANALRTKGATCTFICREHAGNLIDYIRDQNFEVICLPLELESTTQRQFRDEYEEWLGCSEEDDANQVIEALSQANIKFDWIVVDHYGISEKWESRVRSLTNKIMVIDDLANRKHDCDLLLDQTFGRSAKDYSKFVSINTKILSGTNYAILRPEFIQWRKRSLDYRKVPKLKNVMISMGGADKDNYSVKILQALYLHGFIDKATITIVTGPAYAYTEDLLRFIDKYALNVCVKSNISNSAELMAGQDLCIGAAGSTSWERCCLGLPTVMFVIAENQNVIAKNLETQGAVCLTNLEKFNGFLGYINGLSQIQTKNKLAEMSASGLNICDGLGTERILKEIYEL